ncbi:MAG: M28 family peptidase [Oscillospiraceae bacterium]|nr:M28 family peptidase [Oscillospiraceae bacterium]
MNKEKMMQILQDTAYVRLTGTDAVLKAAKYIQAQCAEMGLNATLEPFAVALAKIKKAQLFADGIELPCKGYFLAGSGQVEAPLYYLRSMEDCNLAKCKGKIVLVDCYMDYWCYHDLLENGAVGFITYDGNPYYKDADIDQRELRPFVSGGVKIPGVHVNARTAVELARMGEPTVKIVLEQDEFMGEAHNVVLDMPGETDEYIVLSAHYDSIAISVGVYDNMSGAVGLLAMAEYFAKHPHRYGLRFVWTGAEEQGENGSKAYCAAHADELSKFVLNINLDMIGCIMGRFIACVTAEEGLVNYVKYLGLEWGMPVHAYQDTYYSDSTSFADKGVPALSLARIAPNNTAPIHNRYDTMDIMKAEQMEADIAFITAFTDRMANAKCCPVGREIPDNVKEMLDYYYARKRKK